MGGKDIEDALKRLDRLMQEEALMAAAQILIAHAIDNKVTVVENKMDVVMKGRPRIPASHSS